MTDFSKPPRQRDFFCSHCNGRIIIPFDLPSTSGPCPHCSETIVSPAPPAFAQLPAQPQESDPSEQSPSQAGDAVIAGAGSRLTSGDSTEVAGDLSTGTAGGRKGKGGLLPALVGLFLLMLAAGAAVFYLSTQTGIIAGSNLPDAVVSTSDKEIREANYIRIGWEDEAYKVLGNFIESTTIDGKLPHIHNAADLRGKIRNFYGDETIIDSDTPAESFAVQELSEADRRRGIFMLTYDRPPQFDMKDFFRPLASLEVQYGVDEADILLSTMARVSNFAMEPVRVHAFFKRTVEGLKLDWEVFTQTKHRLFRNYVELPDIGNPQVFRILIVEDVPEKGNEIQGARTYRLADPANIEDSARINVKADSEIGKVLSVLNWRGKNQTEPVTRTATVELEWTGEADRPVLEINSLICWEFLGLGGKPIPADAPSE